MSRCSPTAATAFAGRAWCASGRRRTGPSRAPSAPTTAGSAPWSPAARRSAAACWRSKRRPRRQRATAQPRRRRCSCCAASTRARCAPPAEWPRGPSRRSGNPAGGRRCAARCARAAPCVLLSPSQPESLPPCGALSLTLLLGTATCSDIRHFGLCPVPIPQPLHIHPPFGLFFPSPSLQEVSWSLPPCGVPCTSSLPPIRA